MISNQFTEPNKPNGCPLCGRQGDNDHRYCSGCFHTSLNEFGYPVSLPVTVGYSDRAAGSGRTFRWILAIGIILGLLSGIYLGWNTIWPDRGNIDSPKSPAPSKHTTKIPAKHDKYGDRQETR